MDAALPQPGEVIAGRLRLERVIGHGAFGVVMQARHLALSAPVAVKFLLPSVVGDAESVARFLREARAAVRIQNEHVVRVMDVGTLESGLPYIVMELLEGTSLDDLVARTGAVAVPEAARYALQVSEALAEAHALGIVHRDLKPANLFLTRRASGGFLVKVLDFGMSKIVDPARLEPLESGGVGRSLTRTNAVMGSPLFMSPEQFRDSKGVDERTDIWGVGAVLYHLLVGRPPFQAPDLFSLAERVRTEPACAPSALRPEIPRALDAIVLRCLEKDPARRYPTAEALGEALRAILPETTGERSAPVPNVAVDPLAETRRQAPARGPGLAIGAALGGLAVAGAVAFWLWPRTSAPLAPAPPDATVIAQPPPAPPPTPAAPAHEEARAEPKRPRGARVRPATKRKGDPRSEDVLRSRR